MRCCLNLKLSGSSALLRTPSPILLLTFEYGRILGFKSTLAFVLGAFGTLGA